MRVAQWACGQENQQGKQPLKEKNVIISWPSNDNTMMNHIKTTQCANIVCTFTCLLNTMCMCCTWTARHLHMYEYYRVLFNAPMINRIGLMGFGVLDIKHSCS